MYNGTMSITIEILEIIKDLGELGADAITGNLRSIHRMYVPRNTYIVTDRMAKRGLLKKNKSGKRIVYNITPIGRKLLQSRMNLKKRSDSLATVVLFDIPEDRHTERNRLRRFLIRHQFTLLQKSVLISPYELPEEFKGMLRELNLVKHVKILSAKIEY